jgi:hypothetical protein
MCEFISWIKKDGKVLFLTDEMMLKKEKKMRVKFPDKSERQGHGAIRWYYQLESGGEEKECTDFSSQKNFPIEIANAIKKGEMTYEIIDDIIKQILTPFAWAEYNKITDTAFINIIRKKKNRCNSWK